MNFEMRVIQDGTSVGRTPKWKINLAVISDEYFNSRKAPKSNFFVFNKIQSNSQILPFVR
jgi:hypothetical protein